jgi:hypothetical protein
MIRPGSPGNLTPHLRHPRPHLLDLDEMLCRPAPRLAKTRQDWKQPSADLANDEPAVISRSRHEAMAAGSVSSSS